MFETISLPDIIQDPIVPEFASIFPAKLASPLESIKKFLAVIEPALKSICKPASAKTSFVSGPSQLFDCITEVVSRPPSIAVMFVFESSPSAPLPL